MNSLVENGTIKTKTIKKVTVFWINQDNAECLSDKDLEKLDAEIRDQQAMLLDLENQVRDSSSSLKQLLADPKNDELDALINETRKEIEANKARIEQSKSVPMPKITKEELENSIKKYQSTRKKRKSIYLEISDSIQENLGAAKMKKIREEIDFQTDPYLAEPITTGKGKK